MDRGDLIAARRALAALTQPQLAELAGVSLPTIQRAEAGHPLHVSTIRKIADALGMSPGDRAMLVGW